MLRILISVIVSRGPRNQHILAQGRNFLSENRQCMQGVFKAATRDDQISASAREALDELVDYYSVLIHATDFIEVRETRECFHGR